MNDDQIGAERPPRTDDRFGGDRRLSRTDDRRTLLAGGLVVLCLLQIVSTLSGREIAGIPASTLSPAFDSLSTVLILVGLLVSTVGPHSYAAWNGGPVLSFTIALVPELVGEALACYVTAIQTDGPAPPVPASRRQVGVASVLVAGAAGAACRFALTAPERLLLAYRPFALLWTVPLAVAALFVCTRRR